MRMTELIKALRGLKVETGSLVCTGCQHKDNCGIKGCALIRAAVEQLEVLQGFEEWLDTAIKDKGDDPDESAQEAAGERIP